MSEENKEIRKENRMRMTLALVTQFAKDLGVNIKKIFSYDDLSEPLRKFGETIIQAEQAMQELVDRDEPVWGQDIAKETSRFSAETVGSKLMKFTSYGDDKVCPKCRAWQGKIIAIEPDGEHETVDDAIAAGAFHPNCRCSLQELNTLEIPRVPPNPRAHNSEPALETLVFN